MKKILYFALALTLVISLCACGENDDKKNTKDGDIMQDIKEPASNGNEEKVADNNLPENDFFAVTYEKKNI